MGLAVHELGSHSPSLLSLYLSVNGSSWFFAPLTLFVYLTTETKISYFSTPITLLFQQLKSVLAASSSSTLTLIKSS